MSEDMIKLVAYLRARSVKAAEVSAAYKPLSNLHHLAAEASKAVIDELIAVIERGDYIT